MSDVERVAEAMKAANEQTILVDFDVMSEEMIVDWHALAHAAIDALGLTEEWSWANGGYAGQMVHADGSVTIVNQAASRYSRLVGPWERDGSEG